MAIQTIYFEQWLKTATGGKISCTFAFAADRMMLFCHTCQATYTSQRFEGTTVDFGIQQFVELHLHKGGYTKPTGDMVWGQDMKLVPLTADFKGVDGKTETGFAEKLVALQQIDKGKTTFAELPTPAPNPGGEILRRATGRKFR